MEASDQTRTFSTVDGQVMQIPEMVRQVCRALKDKGYDPVDQIVGYLVTGDPSYITSHDQARLMIRQVERNDLLEEIVSEYLRKLG